MESNDANLLKKPLWPKMANLKKVDFGIQEHDAR
jgi:hypothetical protein